MCKSQEWVINETFTPYHPFLRFLEPVKQECHKADASDAEHFN
jgi:hypothetical protein